MCHSRNRHHFPAVQNSLTLLSFCALIYGVGIMTVPRKVSARIKGDDACEMFNAVPSVW